jgi:hypothetical protein
MHIQTNTRTVKLTGEPPDLQLLLYQCECSLGTGTPRRDYGPKPRPSHRLHIVWLRVYSGMDTDAAKELKEPRKQNARLKRLLAEAELVKDALREVAKEKL